VISLLLGLINIGSTVAFNAVLSLVVAGYFSSYLVPIIFMVVKRFGKEPIQFGPWNLGKFGLPINVFAIAYTALTLVFSFFPPGVPVTALNMNWSIAVWGGTIWFGIIYYTFSGHKKYKGPLIDREFLN
jgi:choline transport protein